MPDVTATDKTSNIHQDSTTAKSGASKRPSGSASSATAKRKSKSASSSSSGSSHSRSSSSSSGSGSSSSGESSSSSGSGSGSDSSSNASSRTPSPKKTASRPRQAAAAAISQNKTSEVAKEKTSSVKESAGKGSDKTDKGAAAMAHDEKIRRPARLPRSPSPKTTRLHVGKLTRNVTKAHIEEIFSTWGTIKSVDMPSDRIHPEFNKGSAYVEYDKPESVAKAVHYMDKGQIDGQEVQVAEVLVPRSQEKPDRDRDRGDRRRVSPGASRPRSGRRSPSPLRRGARASPPRGNRTGARGGRGRSGSPPPRRRVERSRSPVPVPNRGRRRHSRSSSSSSS